MESRMAFFNPVAALPLFIRHQSAPNENPTTAAFSKTLSSRNRYSILYRIGAVKKAETRQRKIREFVVMLERGETIHGMIVVRPRWHRWFLPQGVRYDESARCRLFDLARRFRRGT
jgi:hypothetical protein